jgi:hypothetical protein
MKGALGMEHLTPKRLKERALRGVPPLLRTLEDMLKKGFSYGNMHRGIFTAEENLESEGWFIYWGL